MSGSIYTHVYRHFLKLLIEARRKAGLKQTELAACLKRPQSYVSKYERGQRRLDLVEFLEIARILEIDMVMLLQELQEMAKSDPQEELPADSDGSRHPMAD